MISTGVDANSLLNSAIPVLLKPKTWLCVFLGTCRSAKVFKLSSLRYRGIAYVAWKLTYKLLLRPCFLSPLRKIPGPPYRNPVLGSFSDILKETPGAPERRWAEKYGPIVRYIGPLGQEILLLTNPDALHQVLVGQWLDNPRVCLSFYVRP